MNRFDKSTEVMHDLLLIQNDRKAAYEKIVKWPGQDESIRNHIKKLITQCRNSILELRRHIDMTGSDPADRADIRGDIYHEWPGVRDYVSGNSIPDMIIALESNEKQVVTAYQKALQPVGNLCEELRMLINDQLSQIHQSFIELQERKERPLAHTTITEEEKPFVIFRERVLLESSVHSRLLDLYE